MALDYGSNNRLFFLAPVLDSYAQWYHHVCVRLLYPEQEHQERDLSSPGVFEDWASEVTQDRLIEPPRLKALQENHANLHQTADQLLGYTCKSKQKPLFAAFDHFMTLYESFYERLRVMEKDLALKDSGMDPLTGLRSDFVLKKDLNREIERLARKGRAFSLALAQIDRFDDFKAHLNKVQMDGYVQKIAALVKDCLRSFDDAYFLDTGEFVMCFKQTDLTGGISALERLKQQVLDEKMTETINGEDISLTISSCVSEPEPGENFDEIIQNLRRDLINADENGSAVLQHYEISPLERFVKDMNSDPEVAIKD